MSEHQPTPKEWKDAMVPPAPAAESAGQVEEKPHTTPKPVEPFVPSPAPKL